MRDGFLEQEIADRSSVAILRNPAFSDMTLRCEFNVRPVGSGVLAAAVCFRATGTRTYYWLHLDTKNNKIISRGDAAGPYQAFPDACRLTNGDIIANILTSIGGRMRPTPSEKSRSTGNPKPLTGFHSSA